MENIAPALLEWFYKNQRILPFRTDPSPYHVWLQRDHAAADPRLGGAALL